jgi:hypothetical protein
VRQTVGLPGTGFSYTHTSSTHHHPVPPHIAPAPVPTQANRWRGWLWFAVVVAFILIIRAVRF